MRPTIAALLTAFALATAPAAPAPADPAPAFDELMRGLIETHGLPGGSLAVAYRGRLVYAKGFGVADPATGDPVTADTRFRIASVSKPITAIAALTLVDQRKLTLDSPVYPLLADATPPPPGREPVDSLNAITLRHLLQHTGGQDLYREHDGDPRGRESVPMQPPLAPQIAAAYGTPGWPTPARVIGYMRTVEPDAAPGTRYRYNNYGFMLAGEAIAAAAGQPYERYARQHVFAPAGVPDARLGRTARRHRFSDEAVYTDLSNGDQPRPSVIPGEASDTFPYSRRHHEAWGGAGGWVARPRDVVRVLAHALGHRKPHLLKRRTRRQLAADPGLPRQRANFYYGLGFRVQKKRDGAHLYHNGSSNVGAASLMVCTNDRVIWHASFNATMASRTQLNAAFNRGMWDIVGDDPQWPTKDLFGPNPSP